MNISNELIAMILSICGMLITIVSFQCREKSRLLILQTIGSTFYLFSYVFVNGGIAVMLNVIYIVRNLVANRKKQTVKSNAVICALLCVSYVISYVFVVLTADDSSGQLWSLLPVTGAVLGTVATAHTDVNKLRIWKIGDSLSWLTYNIHIGIGALGGIIGEILNLSSIAIALYRHKKIKQI